MSCFCPRLSARAKGRSAYMDLPAVADCMHYLANGGKHTKNQLKIIPGYCVIPVQTGIQKIQ